MTNNELTRHPLTHKDSVRIINSLNASFHRKGELLLPDDELYPESFNQSSVELASKKIFVWLGVKPTGVLFVTNTANNTEKTILVPDEFQNNTVEGAAFLARHCVAYLLKKKGYAHNPELIELGLTELGLGLLVMNAIGSGNTLRDQIQRTLRIGKIHVSPKILDYYSVNEFARRFREYVKEHGLHNDPIAEHTMPWAKRLLDQPQHDPKQLKYEPYVTTAKKQLVVSRIKLAGITTLILMVISFSILIQAQRPQSLSLEMQNQKETIETLYNSFSSCKNSLKIKERAYDSNDIFMIRQLDAHNSRCKSIKNQHDYLVNDFNRQLQEQGLL